MKRIFNHFFRLLRKILKNGMSLCTTLDSFTTTDSNVLLFRNLKRWAKLEHTTIVVSTVFRVSKDRQEMVHHQSAQTPRSLTQLMCVSCVWVVCELIFFGFFFFQRCRRHGNGFYVRFWGCLNALVLLRRIIFNFFQRKTKLMLSIFKLKKVITKQYLMSTVFVAT